MDNEKTNRQLGILGGLSWHSTTDYYKLINKQISRVLGQEHSSKVLVHSLDFREITDLFKTPKLAVQRLVDECLRLEDFGCEGILLASNTVHFAYEEISDILGIPVLHIADAVASKLKENRIEATGLLGTRYTMNLNFYSDYLTKNHGIKVLLPDDADKKIVDSIIYDELVKGVFKKESRIKYQEIIERLNIAGATGVIAGCTEIPLLIKQEHSVLPLVDSTVEHCKMAAEWCLGL